MDTRILLTVEMQFLKLILTSILSAAAAAALPIHDALPNGITTRQDDSCSKVKSDFNKPITV